MKLMDDWENDCIQGCWGGKQGINEERVETNKMKSCGALTARKSNPPLTGNVTYKKEFN
jgi:hypothetical protein